MQERQVAMVDLAEPDVVEIEISASRKTVWVNVNGLCRFRATRIKELVVNQDEPPKPEQPTEPKPEEKPEEEPKPKVRRRVFIQNSVQEALPRYSAAVRSKRKRGCTCDPEECCDLCEADKGMGPML